MIRPSSARAIVRLAHRWRRCLSAPRSSILVGEGKHRSASAVPRPWHMDQTSCHLLPLSTFPAPPSIWRKEGGDYLDANREKITPWEPGRGVGMKEQRQQTEKQEQFRQQYGEDFPDGARPSARETTGDVIPRRANTDDARWGGRHSLPRGHAKGNGRNSVGGIGCTSDICSGENIVSGIGKSAAGGGRSNRTARGGYNLGMGVGAEGGGVGGREGSGAEEALFASAEQAGTSAYVSQAIIRRLARARRQKNWRAALNQLEAIEEEAAEIRRRGRGGRGKGGPVATSAEDWKVWCESGLSKEEGYRARTTVYNIVMGVLGARKRWQEAFMLVETMQARGVEADIYTLNSVLKACGAAGRVELVLCLLEQMGMGITTEKKPALFPLPAPDTISYNIAMSACTRSGNPHLALSLFNAMTMAMTSGVDSDGGGAAAGAAARLAPEAKAEWEKRSMELGPAPAFAFASVSAPRPNLASYNAALSACARCEEGEGLERAFEIFEAMQSGDGGAPSPNVVTYKEIVTVCGRAGHWDQALSWVDAAIEQGLTPTVGLFYEAIAACVMGGVWQRALGVLENMQGAGVSPDKFCSNMAIRACADAGEVKTALQILDDRLYGSMGASGVSYSSILDALAREGDPDLALRLLREITSTTRRAPNSRNYGSVFAAFLNAGDEPGALAIRSEWRAMQSADAAERLMRREDSENFPARVAGGGGGGGTGRARGRGEGDRDGDRSSDPRAAESVNSFSSSPFSSSLLSEDISQNSPPSAFYAPGERFPPADLVGIAAGHADSGSWSECLDVLEAAGEAWRAARAGVLVRANEFLLGGGQGGSGMAGWREAAAKNSDATDRAEEAARALRGCYEAAVEAAGNAGRTEQSLELLKEAVTFANEQGFRIDPSCFVPALRASGGGSAETRAYFDRSRPTSGPRDAELSENSDWDHAPDWDKSSDRDKISLDKPNDSSSTMTGSRALGDGGGGAGDLLQALLPGGTRKHPPSPWPPAPTTSNTRDDPGPGVLESRSGVFGEGVSLEEEEEEDRVSSPCEAAVVLLGRMEDEAGIAPDWWCINTVMEAAVRDRQWTRAATLFDGAEQRQHLLNNSTTSSRAQAQARTVPHPHQHGRSRSCSHHMDDPAIAVATAAASPNDRRGPRELRTEAVNRLSPNVVSYHLAMQACASAFSDHLVTGEAAKEEEAAATARRNFEEDSGGGGGGGGGRGDATAIAAAGDKGDEVKEVERDEPRFRFVERALSLVRGMVGAGVRLRPETAALAQGVCVRAGRMGAAIEVRQAAEEEKKKEEEAFLGRWRLREKRERVLARY